ncbi:MAG: A/G-specific adenine glycosylase [Muribaculaceae bacterium]|nr:A/G-specific adenine glycosylase [Muribaculaceae bacterium]
MAAALLQWYVVHGRELPWRGTGDPYAIWLSEVILQQTRIEQGRPYWERFMARYPTVGDLAAATEDEVLRLWQGLGYYSRGRNLLAAARQVTAMGGFPRTVKELKTLKGVGDYTAAAIASMAFGEPAAVVDGNVYRVLARYHGIDTPINTQQGKRLFTALAQELLPPDHAAAFNQAMMDFGAIWCMPRKPRCGECPLSQSCVAFQQATVDALPVKLKTVSVKTRRFHYVYVRCGRYTALRRRPAGDIWQGLWEPLLVEGDDTALQRAIAHIAGTLTRLRSGVKHVLTHRIIVADLYLLECDERPQLPEGYQWIAEAERDHYAVPRLVEQLFQRCEMQDARCEKQDG